MRNPDDGGKGLEVGGGGGQRAGHTQVLMSSRSHIVMYPCSHVSMWSCHHVVMQSRNDTVMRSAGRPKGPHVTLVTLGYLAASLSQRHLNVFSVLSDILSILYLNIYLRTTPETIKLS